MSIWSDINKRSQGQLSRKEDTVEEDLDYINTMFAKAASWLPESFWTDMFGEAEFFKDIKL